MSRKLIAILVAKGRLELARQERAGAEATVKLLQETIGELPDAQGAAALVAMVSALRWQAEAASQEVDAEVAFALARAATRTRKRGAR